MSMLLRAFLGAQAIQTVKNNYIQAGMAFAAHTALLYRGQQVETKALFTAWVSRETSLLRTGFQAVSLREFVDAQAANTVPALRLRNTGERGIKWSSIWQTVAYSLHECPGALEMMLNLGHHVNCTWVDKDTGTATQVELAQIPGIPKDANPTSSSVVDLAGPVS